MARLLLGLDFGTTSARALAVGLDGAEQYTQEIAYEHGVMEFQGLPAVCRQEARDYVDCLAELLDWAVEQGDIIGIGIDATASTPIPVDASLQPLSSRFPDNPDALAWLWKDHSAQEEAEEITALFAVNDPGRLARVGKYYAEWFWAKALRCARLSPRVFEAAATWLEQCDFLTAQLTGEIRRGSCAAGHKALYYNDYPAADDLAKLHPLLAELRLSMADTAFPCSEIAGPLTEGWGPSKGMPVAVGGVDAHLGAVGAGVSSGRMCMVLGTSACHIAVAPNSVGITSISGISGVADGSVLPGMLGIEAGQAAFGDLLAWVARQAARSHETLIREASEVRAGSNGLLTIDFHAGNRCPFADADLRGATFGQSLQTTHAELYRSAVEALAMGVRQIIELITLGGVEVLDLLACGGVAVKNRFVLQAIADVTGKPVYISESSETCALGAAIFAGVAAGEFQSAEVAQSKLCRISDTPFVPNSQNRSLYDDLFGIWTETQTYLAAASGPINRLRT